jgi:hypothetical protein
MTIARQMVDRRAVQAGTMWDESPSRSGTEASPGSGRCPAEAQAIIVSILTCAIAVGYSQAPGPAGSFVALEESPKRVTGKSVPNPPGVGIDEGIRAGGVLDRLGEHPRGVTGHLHRGDVGRHHIRTRRSEVQMTSGIPVAAMEAPQDVGLRHEDGHLAGPHGMMGTPARPNDPA